MQHRLIILDFLLPTSQDTTVAIHPTVCSLYNPTVSLKIRVFDGFWLILPWLDMRFIATTFQIRSQPFRFIPFVHAQPEPLAWSARLEGIERIRNQLYVVRICSGYNQCKRKPIRVSHQTALYAPFSPVCWVPAYFFEPASGDLVIQPSIDSHDQSIASNCSLASNPFCQKRSNTPASRHSWNRRWAELDEHIPVAFSAFHWQPVLSTKKMAFIAARLSTRLRWVPRGWWVLCSGISGAIFSQSPSLICHLLPVTLRPQKLSLCIIWQFLLG